jgi:hypothetical protein
MIGLSSAFGVSLVWNEPRLHPGDQIREPTEVVIVPKGITLTRPVMIDPVWLELRH